MPIPTFTLAPSPARDGRAPCTSGLARAGTPALLLIFMLTLTAATSAATPIPLLDIGAAGFVGQAQQGPFDQPVQVDSYAQFTATFGASTAGLANPYLAPSAAAFFANGGQHLWVVRTAGDDDASLIGVDGGPGARTGLQALSDVYDVGAVAIPGATSQAVQAALIARCEALGDRVAVLDPVSTNDPNVVITQRAGLASTDGYAALYFPWVVGTPTGFALTLPPSGFVAGIYARTSPPASPAGSTYGIVATATDVSYAVTSTLQNTLNPLGIDAIRYFTGQGVLVFGARTLASNSEWQYVQVRRAGLALEKSIFAGTQWAVFESNDETLWAQLRSDVGDFMFALFQAGWFQGINPTQAYFVRCDATTMTATDIEEGRTIILVGFAPLTPSEFIVLRIVQQRTSPVAVPPPTPSLAFRAPQPNPAAVRTLLSFDLPRTEQVTLRILDVAGRSVRTLAAGEPMVAGPHDRAWDGRDDTGAIVPAGVYLVRLQAGERALTRRVALVR
jgi:FlgD Ig-like domain/Phage tail sheath protein subtilisin-like domain/Phage tail sheath C-terminal domain